MKNTNAFAALAVLAMLTACGQQAPQTPSEAPHVPVMDAPEANIIIGPSSAAGISSAIPMTLEAVREAAPNFDVAQVQDEIEGEPFIAITLSLSGEEAFRLYPSADGAVVHSIATHSSRARSPEGEIIGQSLFRNAHPEGVVFCVTDFAVIHETGFSCSTSAEGAFWRTYRLPDGYDGPSAPFDAIDPDVAAEAMLVEMKWMAR